LKRCNKISEILIVRISGVRINVVLLKEAIFLFRKIKKEVRESSEDEEDDQNQCDDCGLQLSDVNAVQQHILAEHSDKTMDCKLCGEIILKLSFPKHVKRAHNFNLAGYRKTRKNLDDGVQNLCKVEVNSEVLSDNKLDFGNVPMHYCPECNQTYANEINLKKHIYNVHKMKRVRCFVCDKEVNKKSIDRHMQVVHSVKIPEKKERKSIPEDQKIPCYLCSKKCASLLSLHAHIKNIHEAEQFRCNDCDFYGTRRRLEKHIKKLHSEEVFQCQYCAKILKSKSTLKEHMWIHTDHRRYVNFITKTRITYLFFKWIQVGLSRLFYGKYH